MLLIVALVTACSDRLSPTEAVELANTVEESIGPGGEPQRWLGTIQKSDLRLGGPLSTTELRRNGQAQSYRAIVFERVVLPSARLGDAICAGTQRGVYFWRADGDGVLFFPHGRFDDRLVPGLRSCSAVNARATTPVVGAVALDQEGWTQESTDGDISPGAVVGGCGFLQPEAERVLRTEHGITCQLTRHQVHFGATLRAFSAGVDTMRLELDTAEIMGVRYTIDCDVAKSTASVPCAAPRP